MYETFYGLTEKPFNLTPDPRFLYLSQKHQEAFAHLVYGINNRAGFVMISGEIGTGKTTICRSLLNQLDADTEVAFIFNPFLSPIELLRKINEDFGIPTKGETVKELIDELNNYLLAKAREGKNCVLVIDEAQNLEPQVLEQIRLLSNLETETQKLLQIVLLGQPELAQKLELPELRQLNQRITARYHLQGLDFDESLQYIAFRLRVAGGLRKVRFTRSAVKAIHRVSGGTPRVINALCDRALLIGYTRETREITPSIIRRAAREIQGEKITVQEPRKVKRFLPRPVLAVLGLAAAALVLIVASGASPNWSEAQVWWRDAIAWLTQDHAPIKTAGLASAEVMTERATSPILPSDAAEPTRNDALLTESTQSGSPMTIQAASLPASSLEGLTDDAKPVSKKDPLAGHLVGLDAAAARSSSVRAVLRAWNMAALGDPPAEDTPESLAAFAAANGMAFESLTPDLDQLLAINLPALVRIKAPAGKVWTALVGVNDESLRLIVGDAIVETTRADFANYYTGVAFIFWIDPTPNAPVLRPSDRNEAVRTLHQRLAALGLREPRDGNVYDGETEALIARIQQTAGLVVDGITGKQTRMVLTSWAPDSQTPSLRSDYAPKELVLGVRAVSRANPRVQARAEPLPVDVPRASALDQPSDLSSPDAGPRASGPSVGRDSPSPASLIDFALPGVGSTTHTNGPTSPLVRAEDLTAPFPPSSAVPEDKRGVTPPVGTLPPLLPRAEQAQDAGRP